MGAGKSKGKKGGEAPKVAKKSSAFAGNSFDDKVEEMVNQIKAAKGTTSRKDTVRSFNRVLLKSPKISAALMGSKKVFDGFDVDKNGTIERDELNAALKSLTQGQVTDEEISSIFDESDFDHDAHLDFKEFIVCCALVFVMKLLPAGGKVGEDGKECELPAGEFQSEAEALREAFELIIEAYLVFDVDGNGRITRTNMEGVMQELATQSPTKSASRGAGAPPTGFVSMLSDERMEEMDWDHDGSISFKEFVFAFEGWVGVDDELEDLEEEEREAKEAAGAEADGGDGVLEIAT